MKSAFTLIELVFVILLIGILSSIAFSNRDTSTIDIALNQIINHIKYAQHLALIDNKYLPYSLSSSTMDSNQSKYWFKSWWQVRFTNDGDTMYYMILSDKATSSTSTAFNAKITNGQDEELAIDPATKKYLVGNWYELNTDYPNKDEVVTTMNLTLEYKITHLALSNNSYSSSSMPNGLGRRVSILFDELGRPYFDEGQTGLNKSDSNPYDRNERKPLQEILTLKFSTQDESACLSIYPFTGYVKRSECTF